MDKSSSEQEMKNFTKEFWSTFEKTGSIGAFLLYTDIKKREERSFKSKERNNTLQK
ncbi:MAG: hypothetical protein LLG37_00745 [Spirochaetia bacterium]|nr:hypothetical protein [Spirochaetia bacterium]